MDIRRYLIYQDGIVSRRHGNEIRGTRQDGFHASFHVLGIRDACMAQHELRLIGPGACPADKKIRFTFLQLIQVFEKILLGDVYPSVAILGLERFGLILAPHIQYAQAALVEHVEKMIGFDGIKVSL